MKPSIRIPLYLVAACLLSASRSSTAAAAEPRVAPEVKARCLKILRAGMKSDEFWPSIHAAEGLTLAGHGEEVRAYLTPKLAQEKDDQRRCGLARELVRAGDTEQAKVMLDILSGENTYGHVHAAESLYKVKQFGDGRALKRAFSQDENAALQLMAAGALTRAGSQTALRLLRSKLSAEDPAVRQTAAWVIGRVGDMTDIERLKANMPAADDPVGRAYFQHSLAALGDEYGLKALEENLASDDAAIRTYAATFAGDARAVHLIGELIGLLDDPHLDTRLRAAQSLLVLSQPQAPGKDG